MQGNDLQHQSIVRPRLRRRTVLAAGLALGAGSLAGCGDPPALSPLPFADADRGNVTYRTADGIQVVATF
ncbi:MAG: hypothetical protein OXI70_13740, partial [Chloroflexota bacterium]|nr:hypothetical protein [Chloroflexota bacterium]